ncbi:MAG: hypothetical protein ACO1OY_12235 [Ramlibacter sp.]
MKPAQPTCAAPRLRPVQTCWVGGAPYAAAPLPAPSPASPQEMLLVMIQDSLRRGHHKVAAQRYLMLKSQGHAVPDAVAALCERTVQGLRTGERARMEAAARAWAETWQGLRRFTAA